MQSAEDAGARARGDLEPRPDAEDRENDRPRETTPKRALALGPQDNVAVALEAIRAGDAVCVNVTGASPRTLVAVDDVPFGFKLALCQIPAGAPILKHGQTIGRSTSDIGAGRQVHVHNVNGIRVQGKARSVR